MLQLAFCFCLYVAKVVSVKIEVLDLATGIDLPFPFAC